MIDKKSSIFSSFLWKFLERFAAKGVTVIVSIILARILSPNDYGLVALMMVFINILNVFVEAGLGSALIQKKDTDNLDFSSVFFLNVFVSLICYLGMFFLAPTIADFYDNYDLIPMLRVLSIIILIYSVKNIQQAYVARNMMFKVFFFATLGGTVAAAIVGITMAVFGFGAWAIIIQYLVNAAIDTLVLWLIVDWRPNLEFSFIRIKQLFTYGWKLMVSGIIYAFYNDFRQLVISKVYSTSDLAYYEKAYIFPRYLVLTVNNSIDSVIFPVMSRSQEDRLKILSLAKKTIKLSTYVMFPLMAGMFVCADTVITLLLTDKWLPCVPYLRAFCFVCAFWSFSTANQNILKALGKSKTLLIIEIVGTVINFLILIIFMNYGVFAIAIAWCISVFLDQIILSIPVNKVIQYGYLSQIKDICSNLFITMIMAGVVWMISIFKMTEIITLVVQVIVGATIYVLMSVFTKNESYGLLLKYIKSIIYKN